jgi:hypothetical protein
MGSKTTAGAKAPAFTLNKPQPQLYLLPKESKMKNFFTGLGVALAYAMFGTVCYLMVANF